MESWTQRRRLRTLVPTLTAASGTKITPTPRSTAPSVTLPPRTPVMPHIRLALAERTDQGTLRFIDNYVIGFI